MKNIKKQKGFTLIELMLVVLIIGILSGVMLNVINIRGIQQKSRDARRVSDLKKIQTALELYYADLRGYPVQTTWGNVSTSLTTLVPDYISKMPSDPVVGTSLNACFGNTAYGYYYITPACVGDGCSLVGRYVLGAIMEVSTSASDNLCSGLNNCVQGHVSSCSCTNSYCYGVENPL